MTPTSNCYFDYSQALTGESDNTRELLTTESVYNYEPVPLELSNEEAGHILGSQGNVWTEWIADAKRVEYMVMPRMCALSEMVWTQKDLRIYDDFVERMGAQYDRLGFAEVNYRVPTPFVLGGTVVSFADTVVVVSGVPLDATTYFTMDGEEPNRESFRYTGPIKLGTSSVIKARTYLSNGRASNVVTFDFNRLDSTLNGLIYSVRSPKEIADVDPNLWVLGKSGIANSVALPESPMIPGPFSVTFSGFLKIEKEGLYSFYLRADSGSILSVNHVELVNGGPADPGWWRSGKIYLKAGKYPLMVLDLELDRWRGVAMEFDGPGIERQTIPPRLLTRK
jgi:hexosaminidase